MEIDQVGLDPDEPHTPTWFSFLGLSLFLLAGIFFLFKSAQTEDDTAPDGAPAAQADQAVAEEAAAE